MSFNTRQVLLGAGLLALSAAAFAAKPVRTIENPLRIGVVADTSAQQAFTGNVQFKLTNTSHRAVKLPSWQTPMAGLNADLFELFLDGKKVEYTGILVKRAKPVAADFIVLRPGETRLVNVDLSEVYDLSKTGQYSVRFKSYLQDAQTDDGRRLATKSGRMASLQSAPMLLWVDGEAVREQQKLRSQLKGKPGGGGGGGGGTVVNGVTYVGCSTTQTSQIGSAITGARAYSENARGYYAGNTFNSRYSHWFGAYSSGRYNTATSHYNAIDTALDQSNGQLKINCGCKSRAYAYVYPNQAYQIWVCRAFWTAPTTGADSKAGTLIHETSHFDIVANTDDVVYGMTGAANLANSNPTDALRNADNHEYFAENVAGE